MGDDKELAEQQAEVIAEPADVGATPATTDSGPISHGADNAQPGDGSDPRRSHELDKARLANRTELWLKAIPWIGLIVLAVVISIPLSAMQPMIEDLAGKRTNISATFSLSIAINVILGGAYFQQRRKSNTQTKELIRLRSRLEEIDAQRATKREG